MSYLKVFLFHFGVCVPLENVPKFLSHVYLSNVDSSSFILGCILLSIVCPQLSTEGKDQVCNSLVLDEKMN